jgi:hypothetical protein
MSRKYFGTDGVRGTVGEAPITPDFVMRLGYAAGKVLAGKAAGSGRPTVLIGKDTRVSGYMLESALEAGLSSAGVDVLLVGLDLLLVLVLGLDVVAATRWRTVSRRAGRAEAQRAQTAARAEDLHQRLSRPSSHPDCVTSILALLLIAASRSQQ